MKKIDILSDNNNVTPMIKQYLQFKKLHPDKIVLFRMGDFYETFYDDAEKASKVLGITLTSRNKKDEKSVPLAGFPYHALKNYLDKLVKSGHKVVICEQIEDPKTAKGIVRRDITEIITPGAILDDNLIDKKENNFLAAVVFAEKSKTFGLSFLDISTGDFLFTEVKEKNLSNELMKMNPREIVVMDEQVETIIGNLSIDPHPPTSLSELKSLDFSEAKKILKQHFKTITLEGFGSSNKPFGIAAAALALSYVKNLYSENLTHINSMKFYSVENYLQIDEISIRNLELVKSIRFNTRPGSLISVIDNTLTPMGSRLLYEWLIRPLIEIPKIEQRLDCVEVLYNNIHFTEDLRKILRNIGDLSRIVSKVATLRVNPRELIALKNYLSTAPEIENLLNVIVHTHKENCQLIDLCDDFILEELQKQIRDFSDVIDLIDKAVADVPPIQITQGNIIASGFSRELDDLREMSTDGKSWIARLEESEKQKTGINSLKVGYNKVFGYYIEVTNIHKHKVPDYYVCKQTLTNSERYFSPQLKEYESKVLSAEERIKNLEYELFNELRKLLFIQVEKIQKFIDIVAVLDVLTNLAFISYHNSYNRPDFNNRGVVDIKGVRHPVIEQILKDEEFIPNDVELDNENQKVILLTGPNMAGKSTYLRQIGLLVVMAQLGCYVPADSANICIFDRIFTRVGASDNLAMGQSTFLVEMIETANILNSATSDSLILLDEIGRGTSTFDGLSLAWSIVEYIVKNKKISAKTLFATHYHEITELEHIYPVIKNYNIAIKEIDDELIFLRKIEKGPADKSYGIQVAKLAGLPAKVISRAQKILINLEKHELSPNGLLAKSKDELKQESRQLDFFDIAYQKVNLIDDLIEEIVSIDLKNTTPMEALQIISELQEKLRKER